MTSSKTARQVSAPTLLTLLCVAQFMLIVDVTVVTVAIPAIQRAFTVAPENVQWLTTAYGLTFGGLLISAGRAADLFGPRRLLIAGLAVFTLASAACGVAPSAELIFAARAVQGAGAAMVSPAALALLTTNFAEGAARNKAFGVWGAVASGGGVTGNLLGGLLTDIVGWRWVFLVNVPIGLVLTVVVARLIPADDTTRRTQVDLPGALLLTLGVVGVVAAVSQAPVRGVDWVVLLSLVVGVALLAALVVVERRTRFPILKLSMLANRNVRYGNAISIVAAGASAAAIFFGTLYMQDVLGLSPLQTGLGFIPVLVSIIVVSSKAGALVTRFGVRTLLVASAVLIALGLGLLGMVTVGGTYLLQVLPGMLILGVGSGLSLAPAMIVSTTNVANEDQGLASGLLNTSQQLGAVIGVVALNAVAVAVAGGAAAGLGDVQTATAGYRAAFLAGLVAPALMVLCAFLVPRPADASSDDDTEPAAQS